MKNKIIKDKFSSFDFNSLDTQIISAYGCRYESNCPPVEPGTLCGVPSVDVFLRNPSPYLREFRRKPRKIPNG